MAQRQKIVFAPRSCFHEACSYLPPRTVLVCFPKRHVRSAPTHHQDCTPGEGGVRHQKKSRKRPLREILVDNSKDRLPLTPTTHIHAKTAPKKTPGGMAGEEGGGLERGNQICRQRVMCNEGEIYQEGPRLRVGKALLARVHAIFSLGKGGHWPFSDHNGLCLRSSLGQHLSCFSKA